MIALFFSDLHIGSRQSSMTVNKLVSIVESERPDRVYFIGDTVDLFVSSEQVLSRLKNLMSRLVNQCIFINGNHDSVYGQDILCTNVGQYRVRMMHGHVFESRWVSFIDPIAVKINEIILAVTGVNCQALLRGWLKQDYPEGQFVPRLYEQRAKVLEHGHGVDVLITGHTHYPEITRVQDLLYVNPGNWETYVKLENNQFSIVKV